MPSFTLPLKKKIHPHLQPHSRLPTHHPHPERGGVGLTDLNPQPSIVLYCMAPLVRCPGVCGCNDTCSNSRIRPRAGLRRRHHRLLRGPLGVPGQQRVLGGEEGQLEGQVPRCAKPPRLPSTSRSSSAAAMRPSPMPSSLMASSGAAPRSEEAGDCACHSLELLLCLSQLCRSNL